MRGVIFLTAIGFATPALAGGPTHGTFAGQTTRGERISANTGYAKDAGTKYGQALASGQAQSGVRGDAVQNNIGLSDEVKGADGQTGGSWNPCCGGGN